MGIGRDETVARLLIRDGLVDRVEREKRITGEIHLGDHPLRESVPNSEKWMWPPGARRCGGCATGTGPA